jgi:hypothetical protein
MTVTNVGLSGTIKIGAAIKVGSGTGPPRLGISLFSSE